MENTLQKLDSLKEYQKFEAIRLVTGEKVRCIKEPAEEDGKESTFFVYLKRKKRYGYRYNPADFAANYDPIILSDQEKTEIWHKRIRRALKKIEESGLWKNSNVEEMFRNLLKISLQEKHEILCTADQRKLEAYMEKYPFMFQKNDCGELTPHPKYSYESELADCRMKTMYFGKYENFQIKESIKNAMSSRRNISRKGYTNYDVSFELKYDTEDGIPRAWYSEEYKGCGNGHYYIAISENSAIFCEDD